LLYLQALAIDEKSMALAAVGRRKLVMMPH
jgi:hypothetical protein